MSKTSIRNVFQETPAPKKEPEKKSGEVKQFVFKLNMSAKKQVAMLALDEGKTQQEMFIEALNDLFMKYNKPPIA